jgi:peptidoglycan/xylan/chitin deacetylase (PgdA/CDA1 family)
MILMYHKVDLITPTMWWITPADLERQIASLADKSFVYLEDYTSPEREVVLTFDDAYENVYHHALPILKAHDLPFEVFVIGDQIGRLNEFDARAEPSTRHMSLSQLEEVVREGGRLQWHTRTHPNLPDLTDDELETEMRVPVDLTERFPSPHFTWFSYPGGELDARAIRLARRGFAGAVSVFQGQPDDNWQLNRIEIRRGASF